MAAEADFWSDSGRAEKAMGELKGLKNRLEPWKKLLKDMEDLQTLYELAAEEKDESQSPEIEAALKELLNQY